MILLLLLLLLLLLHSKKTKQVEHINQLSSSREQALAGEEEEEIMEKFWLMLLLPPKDHHHHHHHSFCSWICTTFGAKIWNVNHTQMPSASLAQIMRQESSVGTAKGKSARASEPARRRVRQRQRSATSRVGSSPWRERQAEWMKKWIDGQMKKSTFASHRMIKCCILIERRVAIQKGMYEMDGWMDGWIDECMNTKKISVPI